MTAKTQRVCVIRAKKNRFTVQRQGQESNYNLLITVDPPAVSAAFQSSFWEKKYLGATCPTAVTGSGKFNSTVNSIKAKTAVRTILSTSRGRVEYKKSNQKTFFDKVIRRTTKKERR